MPPCQGAPHESTYVRCAGTVTNHRGDPYGAFTVCDTCGTFSKGNREDAGMRCLATWCAVCGQPGADPSSGRQMEITERRVGDVAVVAVSGRVADGTPEADEFRERVLQLVNSAAVRGSSVVFDFSALTYINSVGQRALVVAFKQTRGAGTKFALASLPPLIEERFAISRLNLIFPVYPSVNEAVAALAAHNTPAAQ